MPSIFRELKRRNVVKVGIAYLVVGWLLIQAAGVLEPALLLPDWVDRVVTVFLLFGFPIVLIFAWAFEITPDGIKLTSKVDPQESITSRTGKKLEHSIIVLLTVALAFFGAREILNSGDEVTESPMEVADLPASIAVLPFEDYSEARDQEYFSKGISEEILNLLAKTNALRVAARTSSFAFAGSELDIRDIGEKLDVGTVLEGSIRKSGDTIRVTAQLINVADGYHLWSETYDRDYADIFRIQDEIAAAILGALRVHLLGEEAVPAHSDADLEIDLDAYNAFLIGKERMANRTREDIEAAMVKFDEAISLDAKYALPNAYMAHALLLLDQFVYDGERDNPADVDAQVLPYLEKALELAPGSEEVLAISGYHHLQRHRYAEAEQALDAALKINPNFASAYSWRADTAYEQERYLDMLADKEKAYSLDPMSLEISADLAYEYGSFWRPRDADRVVQRMFDLHPDHPLAYDAALANLSSHGRVGEALLLADKALAVHPDSSNFLDWKAWLLMQIDLNDQSIELGVDEASFYAYWNKGDLASLQELIDRNMTSPPDPDWHWNAKLLYRLSGGDTNSDEFRKMVLDYIDLLESRNVDWRNKCFTFLAKDLRDAELLDDGVIAILDQCSTQYEERLKVGYLCPCSFMGVVFYTAVDGRIEEAIERADQWLSNGDSSTFFKPGNPIVDLLSDHARFDELMQRNEEQMERQRNIYFSGGR